MNSLCQATAFSDTFIASAYIIVGIMYVHLKLTVGTFKVVFPDREML